LKVQFADGCQTMTPDCFYGPGGAMVSVLHVLVQLRIANVPFITDADALGCPNKKRVLSYLITLNLN
jgi:hypothetical protein